MDHLGEQEESEGGAIPHMLHHRLDGLALMLLHQLQTTALSQIPGDVPDVARGTFSMKSLASSLGDFHRAFQAFVVAIISHSGKSFLNKAQSHVDPSGGIFTQAKSSIVPEGQMSGRVHVPLEVIFRLR